MSRKGLASVSHETAVLKKLGGEGALEGGLLMAAVVTQASAVFMGTSPGDHLSVLKAGFLKVIGKRHIEAVVLLIN